jgi:hypothetical protein
LKGIFLIFMDTCDVRWSRVMGKVQASFFPEAKRVETTPPPSYTTDTTLDTRLEWHENVVDAIWIDYKDTIRKNYSIPLAPTSQDVDALTASSTAIKEQFTATASTRKLGFTHL